MPELSTAEALLRLLIAAGLGGAIGLERELRDHEAGFRTHLLVSLGACVFTLVSAYGWTDWTFSQRSGVVFDPTRIAAQIVTGVGFLGAGAIIVRGISVRGLTTAATLWAVAAIGMAAGTGYYAVGVGAAVLVLISLGPLEADLDARSSRASGRRRRELAIELARRARRRRVLSAIEELGGQISAGRVRRRARRSTSTLRASTPGGVGARGRGGQQARRRRARAVAAVKARLASGNGHKLEELRAALPGWELELLGADATTRRRTARPTTRTPARRRGSAASRPQPDAWVLGEDSGIEVAALGGRPGIAVGALGRRDGVAQLLAELDGVDDRRARYVCELVALGPDGERAARHGDPRGTVATERRGDEGFGYDPIFVPHGEERTVAELGDDWKRENSHRARAAAAV